jgi:hypothetical protein
MQKKRVQQNLLVRRCDTRRRAKRGFLTAQAPSMTDAPFHNYDVDQVSRARIEKFGSQRCHVKRKVLRKWPFGARGRKWNGGGRSFLRPAVTTYLKIQRLPYSPQIILPLDLALLSRDSLRHFEKYRTSIVLQLLA